MFFGKKTLPAAPKPAPEAVAKPEWDLQTVVGLLGRLAPNLENRDVEPALVQARLADHYREVDREPVPAARFNAFVAGMDAESWRRLALAVGPLDDTAVRSALAHLKLPVVGQVQAGFVAVARQTDALTLALLRQSPVRVEEFARHLAASLDIGWRGETPKESKNRLRQLDYKRLLAEAEKAKKQAEERMEYLRKKQEEDAARRPRGKQ
jgi:hypothetical protein